MLVLFCAIGDFDIASYADDYTPHAFSLEVDIELKKLRSYKIKIFKWFHNNRLK